MSRDQFNPYREWLGFRKRPRNYYALLGLSLWESDAMRIASAASLAIGRLRSHQPGSRRQEWLALMDQLSKARDCLLDDELRRRYDLKLREKLPAVPPPAPSSQSSPEETSLPEFDAFDPMTPLDLSRLEASSRPGPGEASELPQVSSVERSQQAEAVPDADRRTTPSPIIVPEVREIHDLPRPSRRDVSRRVTRRRVRRQMHPRLAQGIIYGSFLLSLLALLGGFFWIVQHHVRPQQEQRLARQISTPETASDLPLPDSSEPLFQGSHVDDKMPGDKMPDEPVSGDDARDDLTDAPISTSLQPEGMEPATSVEVPESSIADQPSEPEVTRAPDASPGSPTPPASMVATEAATATDDRRVAELLVEAWQQLELKDLPAAQRSLDQARRLANGTEWQAEVERLSTLHQHLQQFWQAFHEGLEGLEGTELKLKSTRVFVVQMTSEQLTLRMLGANRRFAVNELPPGLTLAIADRWLDSASPTTSVLRGSYMATTPPFTLDDVNGEWSQAESRGIRIGDLQQTLADRQSLPSRLAKLRSSSPP